MMRPAPSGEGEGDDDDRRSMLRTASRQQRKQVTALISNISRKSASDVSASGAAANPPAACTDAQIAYFPVHVEADTEHGGKAYDLVEKYARSEDQRRRAVLAAREGAEKRWFYIDGIYIHYVLGYKLTDARWDEYQAEWGPSPFYRGVW